MNQDTANAIAASVAALTSELRAERDALRAECERLRAFVAALRADGLDIDDPTTAPVWTGKIHVDGRLVFDLATVGTPCPRCIEAIARRDGAPPTCTWCGLPIAANAVTRTDAAGVAHAFHGACYSAHAEWISGLARGTP